MNERSSSLPEEGLGRFARIAWTILLLGAAVGAPFALSFVGLFAGLLLVIVWYAWIGHDYSGLVVDRIASPLRGDTVEPSAVFEPKVLKLIQQGCPERALETCQDWIRHDGCSAAPHLMAARILATHLKQTDRAIRALEYAVRRPLAAADLVEVALYLAELYRRMGRVAEIAPTFHRIRTMYPRSPEIARLPAASP